MTRRKYGSDGKGKTAVFYGKSDCDTSNALPQCEMRNSSLTETKKRKADAQPAGSYSQAFPTDEPRSPFAPEPLGSAQEHHMDIIRLQKEDQSRRIQELEKTLNKYMPVSVSHFDQAMADLMQRIKPTSRPVDHQDELAVLLRKISKLTKERDDARAEATELEEATEATIEKQCQKMKEMHNASMDAKIAQSLAAVKKKLEHMTHERDRLSNRADNLLNKLTQVESDYDSLRQREDAVKEGLRAQVETLQKRIIHQEQTIKARDTRTSPVTRSSVRLADLVRERDEAYKRQINQLTKERDEALSQVAIISGQQDTSRKRPRRRE